MPITHIWQPGRCLLGWSPSGIRQLAVHIYILIQDPHKHKCLIALSANSSIITKNSSDVWYGRLISTSIGAGPAPMVSAPPACSGGGGRWPARAEASTWQLWRHLSGTK